MLPDVLLCAMLWYYISHLLQAKLNWYIIKCSSINITLNAHLHKTSFMFANCKLNAYCSKWILSSQLYVFFSSVDGSFMCIFCLTEELPVLDNEMFHSIKPGLSAYADTPEMVRQQWL